ncbi:UNVERIFIED_CONTAM: hypothetical protein Scaly_3148300 [Sesamum calycinum]|uniref:Reverse transcriptase domain-containing protein n=1 Tax=Sesamum calycinum TaxID=2727403 RepID=A0AAW2JFN1_9LAMI
MECERESIVGCWSSSEHTRQSAVRGFGFVSIMRQKRSKTIKLVEEGSDDRNVVKEDEEPTTYALALYLPYPPPSLLGMRKEGDVRISSNWRNWNWKKLPLALLPLMLKSLPVLIVQSSKLKRPAVVAVVKKTFEEGRIPDNMNNILITLIPKQEKPATLAQCRPIPLCNVIYKVIAKVAVSRLRPLLEKLLSPNQNSFIPGRGTT